MLGPLTDRYHSQLWVPGLRACYPKNCIVQHPNLVHSDIMGNTQCDAIGGQKVTTKDGSSESPL